MKIDYEKKMQDIIDNINLDQGKKTLLIHSCCAPCSAAILEFLKEYFDITILFYNPNITDVTEYNKRIQEQQDYLEKNNLQNIKLISGEYNPEKDFFQVVKGLENLPEGGERCFICYEKRLEETAKKAKELGFDYFTTVLSISPLKNSTKINLIGENLEVKYGVNFLYADFKKKNRYKRGIELSKINNLYRQDYCGCIFSKTECDKRQIEKQNNIIILEDIKTEDTFLLRQKGKFSLFISIFIHLIVLFPIVSILLIKGDMTKNINNNAVTVQMSESNDILGETKGFTQKQEGQEEKKKSEDSTENTKKTIEIKPINDMGQKVIEKEKINKEHNVNKKEEKIFKDGNDDKNQKFQENIESSFEMGSDGEKILKNQNIKGVEYKILNAPAPNYPSIAKKFNLGKVPINARFLVGKTGSVEKIEILSGRSDLGFKQEIEKALKQWKFTPVTYKDEVIKLYFYKEFIFELN